MKWVENNGGRDDRYGHPRLITEVLVMMEYRHAYEPILRWRALAISTVAIVAAVVMLDSIL